MNQLVELKKRLLREMPSGQYTIGSGHISSDGKYTGTDSVPIMQLANPDGPEAATAITDLEALVNELGEALKPFAHKAFVREGRYIVIKRKNLSEQQERDLREGMRLRGIETVECVVVESDWPEYETVWRMIEDRVTGNTRATLAKLEKARG